MPATLAQRLGVARLRWLLAAVLALQVFDIQAGMSRVRRLVAAAPARRGDGALVAARADRSRDLLAQRDGLWVFAPGWLRGAPRF